MTGLKVMAVSVVGAAVWQLASSGWETLVHNIALELAVGAAGVAGAGVLWKKVVVPVWTVLRKIDRIAEAVSGLPAWQASMEERMADGAAHFDRLDAELAAWASADRLRMTQKLDELQDPRGRP